MKIFDYEKANPPKKHKTGLASGIVATIFKWKKQRQFIFNYFKLRWHVLGPAKRKEKKKTSGNFKATDHFVRTGFFVNS